MIAMTCLRSAAGMPARKQSSRAIQGCQPASGSMCSRAIASGSFSATSSMSTPPLVVSMKSGRLAPRSNVIEK